MCILHHKLFDDHYFFIRYVPLIKKFILVNLSGLPSLKPFHGKAVALDTKDKHVPFPFLFIIHEVRVKAANPFRRLPADIDPNTVAWQDWILSGGIYDQGSDSFNRDAPSGGMGGQEEPGPENAKTPPGGEIGGNFMTACIDPGSIAAILAETRAMPTWRACEMENIGWTGTAEQNIKKYVERIGVEFEDD